MFDETISLKLESRGPRTAFTECIFDKQMLSGVRETAPWIKCSACRLENRTQVLSICAQV